MASAIFRRSSLKTRITLTTLAIFLVGVWSLAFYASRMLREDMQRLLGDQQFSTVSFLAAEINHELNDRLRILEDLAEAISPTTLSNPAALQQLLEDRQTLQSLFNGGAVAYGSDGTAVAEVPRSVERVGVNYLQRDYLIGALREGKATIGRPIMGPKLKAPVFVMAVPIHDGHGKVIGALGGVVNLGMPNFLDKIAENRHGKTGGYLLIAPQYRLIVTATDRRRIMETLPTSGISPAIDRFVQGYEGSELFVNPLGVEVLASAKTVSVAGWQTVVSLPTAEAFAPIKAMQQRMLLATFMLTLLAGGLTWWMLKRQLSPMLAAAKTLAALSDASHPPQPLPITRQDEIGQLIGGFNHLLETLAQREAALRESEARFRGLTEMSSDFYWESDAEHRLTQRTESKREAAESVFREAASVGKRRWEIPYLSPDEAGWQKHREILDAHLPFRDFEILRLRVNGARHHISVSGDPVFNGAGEFTGYRGVGTDITERKQMEDQVRQLAFYDPLTRLPNRRLLDDRLRQTMASSKRSGCYGALMFLDLDNFKPLNDLHGHAVGDLLLVEVAERLRSCVREMDTVARFGGDEFVVMLSELGANKAESATQAAIVAEKIRIRLSEPYLLTIKREGKADTTVEHHCTVSIGVTLFINHEASQDDILKWADAAMYQAKEAGRNSIRFYESPA